MTTAAADKPGVIVRIEDLEARIDEIGDGSTTNTTSINNLSNRVHELETKHTISSASPSESDGLSSAIWLQYI